MPGMTLAIEPMINLGRADVAWEIRDLRIFMKMSSDSVSYQVTYDSVVEFCSICTNCLGNNVQMISGFCKFDSFKKALFCNFHQLFRFRRYLTDCISTRCILMISFIDQSGVNLYKIAFLDDLLSGRDSMYDFIIQTDAK